MDPIDDGPSGGRFETFDVNERFVVVRDDEGYGVWRLDDLEDGYPIERFPDTDVGFEEAATRWKELTRQDRRERNPWLPRIKWFVVASAVIWTVAAGVFAILLPQVNFSFGGRGLFQALSRWAQVAQLVAQPATLGGFAVYVVLWLESRRDR